MSLFRRRESGRKELEFKNDAEFKIVFHVVGEVKAVVSPEIIDFFKFVSDEKTGVEDAVFIHFFG